MSTVTEGGDNAPNPIVFDLRASDQDFFR